MSARRSFLLLQGPVGPFFAELGRALALRGHEVTKVAFNGGDQLQWQAGDALPFAAAARDWSAFVHDLAHRGTVTDLVVFGDCRPRHRVALCVLRPLGTRIHVFEEGYFRPDWITLERDGVNGHSRLPRDPAWYLAKAAALAERPRPESHPVGATTRAMVGHTLGYHAGVALLAARFRQHHGHRCHHPSVEAASWIERGLRLAWRRRLARARQRALLGGSSPYYLLALQLDADMQVRRHSPFAGMAEVTERVLRAFAAGASPSALLAVKSHPLDPGLIDLERVVARQAQALQIAGRVVYLDGGDLPSLVAAAQGVIVVNSTAGLSAIHRGVPTLALGRALYDLVGLTHGAGRDPAAALEDFWHRPRPPDMALYRAFRRVVMAHTQINGSFYTRIGRTLALPAALVRLETAGPTRWVDGGATVSERENNPAVAA
jgi:capsular polysaccharide export protein